MVPFDRFAVVLDACTMFPMLVRDVLLTLAAHEKRAVAAFRELRARKKNPPMDSAELIRRLRDGGLVQTSLWLNTHDVVELI